MLLAGGVGVGAGVVVTLGVAALVVVPIVPTGGSVAVGLAEETPPLVEVAVISFSALVAVDVPSDGLIVQAASGMARRNIAISVTTPTRRARTCRLSSLGSGRRCDMHASFRIVFITTWFC
jgi:hypothetical protein